MELVLGKRGQPRARIRTTIDAHTFVEYWTYPLGGGGAITEFFQWASGSACRHETLTALPA